MVLEPFSVRVLEGSVSERSPWIVRALLTRVRVEPWMTTEESVALGMERVIGFRIVALDPTQPEVVQFKRPPVEPEGHVGVEEATLDEDGRGTKEGGFGGVGQAGVALS